MALSPFVSYEKRGKKTGWGFSGAPSTLFISGIFGLANQVKERFELDEVVFIPAYISPHKQDKETASADHRLAMLRLAIAPYPYFKVSEIELKRQGVSYTVDTLAALKSQQPETDFFLIMGMDAFAGLPTWKDTVRLFKMCHLIVAARPGHSWDGIEGRVKGLFKNAPGSDFKPIKTGNVKVFEHAEGNTTLNFFNLVPMAVSSSEIREKLAHHRELKNRLPPEVENYIMRNQLYRAKSLP